MTLRALLLCRDVRVLAVLPRLLERAKIQVERCAAAPQAIERLAHSKYEAVIVDCDDPTAAAAVLKSVRSAPSNRRALTLALVTDAAPATSAGLGANFVLEKPIVAERAARVLRAAYGLMTQERRRYHRLPANQIVYLSYESVLDQRAVMLNLSQGGVALRGVTGVPSHHPVFLRFSLPGVGQSIEAQAETTWTSGERLGVKFVKLAPTAQRRLELWLGMRLEGRDFALTPAALTPQD
ncbi:MAG TPA: PilZ domain-containing protein [Terriglobales bacterium]|nr:PilZ domain-containing protein [Terriglobales bacterium]